MVDINSLLLADAYKYQHYRMQPEGTQYMFSTWTPRSSRDPNVKKVVHLGLQYFIKEYLIRQFNENFFNKAWHIVDGEIHEVLGPALGITVSPHFKWLHELGYLPIKIYSVPEGDSVPLNTPTLVITNTLPEAYWLVNFIETLMSNVLWMPCTSATTAKQFRDVAYTYAALWRRVSGQKDTDLSYLDFQCHDFSMRGMAGLESACLSGMGHLTQFKGTDTIPAIPFITKYYHTSNTGFSVSASEHSVMCAGTKDGEFETFKRLLDLYPEGPLSIVSDTWDLWKVLDPGPDGYLTRMKDQILKRNGVVVIRPDSSGKDQTPVDIVCGDPRRSDEREKKGVLRLLNEIFGNTNGIINKAACIYGDGIDITRFESILNKTVYEIGLSPANFVAGVGSYTYQYKTRDNFGFAMKATAVIINGKLVPIFKDPVTDGGGKKSHYGIVCVYKEDDGGYSYEENCTPRQLDTCSGYRKVFDNGNLLIDYSFNSIRERVKL